MGFKSCTIVRSRHGICQRSCVLPLHYHANAPAWTAQHECGEKRKLAVHFDQTVGGQSMTGVLRATVCCGNGKCLGDRGRRCAMQRMPDLAPEQLTMSRCGARVANESVKTSGHSVAAFFGGLVRGTHGENNN